MKNWHIALRNAARRLGVSKLAYWWANRHVGVYRDEYRRLAPKTVNVGSGSWISEFHVGDETEFVNLFEKNDDAKIMRAMHTALPAGSIVWDVGANVGVYSLIAAKMVGPTGSVLAFEPEPKSRERLLQNVVLNNLDNVEAAPLALGLREGTLAMAEGESASSGTHRVLKEGERAPPGQVIHVRVTSGDAYRSERDLPVPHMIKIDVEGAELDVVEGLRATLSSRACKNVICEVHFGILQAKGQGDALLKIAELLNACGFTEQRWLDRSHLAAQKS